MAENEKRNTEQKDCGISPYDKNGYCPYTEDRRCRTGRDGGFHDDEECQMCGWRAW